MHLKTGFKDSPLPLSSTFSKNLLMVLGSWLNGSMGQYRTNSLERLFIFSATSLRSSGCSHRKVITLSFLSSKVSRISISDSTLLSVRSSPGRSFFNWAQGCFSEEIQRQCTRDDEKDLERGGGPFPHFWLVQNCFPLIFDL